MLQMNEGWERHGWSYRQWCRGRTRNRWRRLRQRERMEGMAAWAEEIPTGQHPAPLDADVLGTVSMLMSVVVSHADVLWTQPNPSQVLIHFEILKPFLTSCIVFLPFSRLLLNLAAIGSNSSEGSCVSSWAAAQNRFLFLTQTSRPFQPAQESCSERRSPPVYSYCTRDIFFVCKTAPVTPAYNFFPAKKTKHDTNTDNTSR